MPVDFLSRYRKRNRKEPWRKYALQWALDMLCTTVKFWLLGGKMDIGKLEWLASGADTDSGTVVISSDRFVPYQNHGVNETFKDRTKLRMLTRMQVVDIAGDLRKTVVRWIGLERAASGKLTSCAQGGVNDWSCKWKSFEFVLPLQCS